MLDIPISRYNPYDWYWGPLNNQYYSSQRGAHVSSSDSAYQAFLAQGNTPTPWPVNESGVQTLAALMDVLRPYKLDPSSRIQTRLDDFARTRGYDDIATVCSYKDSTNAAWAAEAARAITLRDTTWAVFIQHENEDWPSIEAALPALSW
jgi:hypothetical protein